MSDARDDILASIRRSLGVSPDDAPRRAEALARLARPPRGVIPQRGQASGRAAVETFIRYAEAAQASVSVAPAPEAVPAEAARWLSARNLPPTARMGADPRLAAMPWGETALEVSHGPSAGQDLTGVSHAFAGIIETGSLVLLSGPDNPTTLNFLPDNHIVVLDSADLVPSLEDVWARLRREVAGAPPRTINMITGPSRSGDIDRTIFLGAHGPRALHVILIDRDGAAGTSGP
ncbi:lactate utilization protein C [Camelimonas abortus]|uniref:Lactate utilization protein C n=1 Tax=Camelimonas abortus TaxID=1017184 RepID=A0ABV7LFZ2_9HYPH